ncbi:MAG TPA: ABC transporter permease [Planctomycetia bacterium]|nr:ABC transporter permease [Planctomycetia bacterium]
MREFRGLCFLAMMTLRRQIFARKTLVAAILVAVACAGAATWTTFRAPDSQFQRDRAKRTPAWLRPYTVDRLVVAAVLVGIGDFHPFATIESEYRPDPLLKFSREMVMQVFVGFLLPILSLLYAGAAIGEEKEERTLVYILVRPLSLWKVYLAKAAGIAPLALAAGVGGFAALCLSGGAAGRAALELFVPAVAIATIAYSSLFLLFGALFSRPMVLGVAYAFFAEFLAGNLPGTLKRLSIAFHCRCIMYDAGSSHGFQPMSAALFNPISGQAAFTVLLVFSALLLAVGAFLFHRKEYRDLA